MNTDNNTINNNETNSKNNIWSIILCIVLIIGILGVGFYMGRKSINTKPKVEIKYIKGDTIKDTIYLPTPVRETIPIDTINFIKQIIADGMYKELWPERVITEYVEVTKQDSTEIINDWMTKRYYSEQIFNNDTIGNCTINAEVQYNRLRLIDYTYNPITKEVTNTHYKVKTFSPFLGGGYMVNPWDDIRDPIITVNGGIFIREKYGLQVQIMHSLKTKNDYIGGSFIYKF